MVNFDRFNTTLKEGIKKMSEIVETCVVERDGQDVVVNKDDMQKGEKVKVVKPAKVEKDDKK